MSPHDVLFGSSRPRARIVMITAITPSENASRRSVVRSNGASDLVGSLIAAMIGLAPRAARWKDEPHGRSRSTRLQKEPRKRRDVSRTYATERIEVTWEPRSCVHV